LSLGFLLLGCGLLTSAQTPAQELDTVLQNLRTMTADFSQVTTDSSGRVLQKTTGNMALQRPGKFRWQTLTPNKQLILADGTYVWVYDTDLAQATRKKMDPTNNANPASLLSGTNEEFQQRYDVNIINQKGGGIWFELRPKSKNDLFQWIKLQFVNGSLQQMVITDNLGQISTFNFSGNQINKELDQNLFVFKAPAGTDVIQEQQ
jgi:outer membrane lipoprotein carrier protein